MAQNIQTYEETAICKTSKYLRVVLTKSQLKLRQAR